MAEPTVFSDVDPDDEDSEYFSELDDFDATDKLPKFVRTPESTMVFDDFSNMKVDELVQTYRALRDQLGTDRRGYKSREDRMKNLMRMVSMILLERGNALGVDSFKTPYGTAFRHVKDRFGVVDWQSLTAYIDETKNFHILQKRVSPNAVREIETTDGALPPGLEKTVEMEFSVRAPTSRKSSPAAKG